MSVAILPIVAALLGVVAFSPLPYGYWFGFIFLVPLFIFFTRLQTLFVSLFGALLFYLLLRLGASYFSLEFISIGVSTLIFCEIPISIFLLRAVYKRVRGCEISPMWVLFSLPFVWTLWDTVLARYSPLPTTILSVGNILGSSSFVGLAVFGGIVGLTLFVTIINALIAIIVIRLSRLRRQGVRDIYLPLAGTVLILGLAAVSSWLILNQRSVEYRERTVHITVTALSITKYPIFSQRILAERAVQETSADLVVFPEVFFTNIGHADYQTEAEMGAAIASLLPGDAALGVGVFNFRPSGLDERYETAVLAGGGGVQGIHHKAHPVFIGEYWPFGSWHPALYDWLRSRNPRYGAFAMFNKQNGYTAGTVNTLTATIGGASTTLAILVCSEMHYPSDILWYRAHGARFLVNSTSNRWLGKGKDHFLFLTNNLRRIEAIETGMPIIVSGFEDVAGVFTPDGREQTVSYQQTGDGYALFSGSIKLNSRI